MLIIVVILITNVRLNVRIVHKHLFLNFIVIHCPDFLLCPKHIHIASWFLKGR